MRVQLAVLVAALGLALGSPPCPQRPPQALYASKTAYQLVHGEGPASDPAQQGCEAVYLWHVVRHGTRFPSAKEIAALREVMPALQRRLARNTDAGRVTLCPEDLDRLLGWRLNATAAQGGALREEGKREMFGIATRLKERLPKFFVKHASPEDFQFRSTEKQRTIDSAHAYASALFKDRVRLPKPLAHDPLLKFYEMCPAWVEAVDRNASARSEATAFQQGPEMAAALRRVGERLGFEEPLSYDEVDAMHKACKYEQAWDPTSPAAWCAAFSTEDLLVFEYRSDLKYYYVDGYGNAMNLQLGCPLVKDVVDKLSAFERKGGPAASVYFTHSTAIHMTLASLGVGRDAEVLTADNFERMRGRQWRVSRLAPFAANLAVVLYECPAGHHVRMLLNEHPVELEGCPAPLCPWGDFKARFGPVASACSLDFCNDEGPAPRAAS